MCNKLRFVLTIVLFSEIIQTAMSLIHIEPESDQTSPFTYRQKLSWMVREEDWNRTMILHLNTCIPAMQGSMQGSYPGGFVKLTKDGILFATEWPKDVEIEKIRIDAVFHLKTNGGETFADIRCDQRISTQGVNYNVVSVGSVVTVNPEHLFDEGRSFTFEADLLVRMGDPNKDLSDKPNSFVKDMKSIFHDVKNSDVLILAENQEFKCHKNILSARSDVFKNTFAHNTLENQTNTIVVKESPAKAVEDMLKHIYTGELPDDPKDLTIDLLNIADMYLLDSLKEACVDNLLDNLDVSSCISTFILADLYFPDGGKLRDKVVMFMKCKVDQLVEMKDWVNLMNTHPALVAELFKAMAKERKEKHKCQFCLVSFK